MRSAKPHSALIAAITLLYEAIQLFHSSFHVKLMSAQQRVASRRQKDGNDEGYFSRFDVMDPLLILIQTTEKVM